MWQEMVLIGILQDAGRLGGGKISRVDWFLVVRTANDDAGPATRQGSGRLRAWNWTLARKTCRFRCKSVTGLAVVMQTECFQRDGAERH